MPAGQATNIAMHTAIEKAGMADDITVLVIDLMPRPGERCVRARCAQPWAGVSWGRWRPSCCKLACACMHTHARACSP